MLLVSRAGLVALDGCWRFRMSVDFSGRWTAELESNPFLPGIEAGMVVFRIDHVEPLLQLTVIASAPRYSLFHFECNHRTDGTEIVTCLHGLQVRTNAHWESNELLLEMHLARGSYRKRLQARWRLSKEGRVLTMQQHDGESPVHVTILQKQDPPEI
jgi:hypothetical protein